MWRWAIARRPLTSSMACAACCAANSALTRCRRPSPATKPSSNEKGVVMQEQSLIEKLRRLPADKQAEVEDFVDFLSQRDEDRHLTRAATRLAEDAFRQVWDNDADAAYGNL